MYMMLRIGIFEMKFIKLPWNGSIPEQAFNITYLKISSWDDFDYETQFNVTVFDFFGQRYNLGDVKIGYKGQCSPSLTRDHIINEFDGGLSDSFFSLGQDVEYYEKINNMDSSLSDMLLRELRDVIKNTDILEENKNESVFKTSLTRYVSMTSISEQYPRVLSGGALLSKFDFRYETSSGDNDMASFCLDFNVTPNIKPPTNIHVLIGRNGIGKTTLLNGMISSLVDGSTVGKFSNLSLKNYPFQNNDISFSKLISVSFSAFDPFEPPKDRIESNDIIKYSYIGLKSNKSETGIVINDLESLSEKFSLSVRNILGLEQTKKRWVNAIRYLESDINFAEMDLTRLANNIDPERIPEIAKKLFLRMSSGHAIVMLTMTRLVELIEEKTLVIMDEPESHLHPPLLSAFIRAISALLIERNGVAIIATHSPVILQEIPKSCVWKLSRIRSEAKQERPERETFGENVGILTKEVFGLEVTKSGYHDILSASVKENKTFLEILAEYDGQIGFEGKAILMALLSEYQREKK